MAEFFTRHKWREDGDARVCEICGRHQIRIPADDWGPGLWTTTNAGLSLEHWRRQSKVTLIEPKATDLGACTTTHSKTDAEAQAALAK